MAATGYSGSSSAPPIYHSEVSTRLLVDQEHSTLAGGHALHIGTLIHPLLSSHGWFGLLHTSPKRSSSSFPHYYYTNFQLADMDELWPVKILLLGDAQVGKSTFLACVEKSDSSDMALS
jgi:hypothetical protein